MALIVVHSSMEISLEPMFQIVGMVSSLLSPPIQTNQRTSIQKVGNTHYAYGGHGNLRVHSYLN